MGMIASIGESVKPEGRSASPLQEAMNRLITLLLALFVVVALPATGFGAGRALAAPKTVASKAKHAAAKPVPTEADEYHRAFTALASNHPQEAELTAEHGRDPILNKVVRGYAMAQPGNDYSFEQMDSFMDDNPGWPGLKGIQMITEQKIPPNASSAQVVAWFAGRPPLTLTGLYRFADALDQTGQTQLEQSAIRDRWINGDFTGDEQTNFYTRYGGILSEDAMWARLDRLLWKGDSAAAQRVLPLVNAGDKAIAEARLAYMGAQAGDPDMWAAHVPSDAQNDPGLLYQRLRYSVKNNRDDEADDMLLHAPADLGNAEAWWELRQIEIHRAIGARNYQLAYQLASTHGQRGSKTLVQAEFLCGWLALRFLDKPDIALSHFKALYDTATSPITRARGAYWLGRTYEALGDQNAARQSYDDAAAFNMTYYGQLALARTESDPMLTARADPPLSDAVRRKIFGEELIRAALRLNDVGEHERAQTFFHAAVENASERSEFAALAEVAQHMHRPDLGIIAVKAASQRDIVIENGGYPLLDGHVPSPPEPAFTHALIRQESMFNPEASSGVGARGLMQLMPRTAKEVAKKIDVRYSESMLGDPSYSLRLGTSFVEQQIEHFNGSYILALAGYNAGPGRVREWIAEFGDPRNGDIDPVDWVEMIPVQETRNYVQRIMENLQIYRARLAGGRAPLNILNDLKR
jgi:soluble lytic murein transglycosylase